MPTDMQRYFEEYHAHNPQVYKKLVADARKLLKRGWPRLSIKMLFEEVRYSHMITHDPSSDFKLNNNLHSRYARLIMAQEPDLNGVFEIRELRT